MGDNDDDPEVDIIQKYLPIFLDLRKQALEEAQKSVTLESQTNDSSAGNNAEVLISNDPIPSTSVDVTQNPPEKKKQKIETDLDAYQSFLDDDFLDSIFNQIPDEIDVNKTEGHEFDDLHDNIINETPDEIDENKTKNEADEDFKETVKFSNISHLHRRRVLAVKRAKLKIPILFIKDVLKATNWTLSTPTILLPCDDLYVNNHAIFSAIICRGTVVGIELKSLKIRLDDGTGMLECCLEKDRFGENLQNVTIDNSSIIQEFDRQSPVEYQGITSLSLIRRGDMVQVIGNLRIYPTRRLLYVKKLCKEPEVSLSREIVFVNLVKRLYVAYSKSKKYY